MSFEAKSLPENLLVGYASWAQCDESIIEAVKDGVNVVMWFSINLDVDKYGKPHIFVLPDVQCTARVAKQLRDLNLPTIHMISIGGWNAPHPDTSNPVEEMYAEFVRWNNEEVKNPALGFDGFDGFDWDIEGHDDVNHPRNVMTTECIVFMGEFSQLGKRDGFLVAMAPAESYLDITTSAYDRVLTHEYTEWQDIQPGFKYHGHNTYAPLLSDKYSKTLNDGVWVDTFDFVFLQFYEGYSHAEYNMTRQQQPPEEYFLNFVRHMTTGWIIDFESDPSIGIKNQRISVPASKLVLGLANGWAGDGKFLLLYPKQVKQAYIALENAAIRPRGCGYWTIKDEGVKDIYLAKGLNTFLFTRALNSS